ncbi:MAG: AhpC/TSA family protein [Rhizobacter sp.]|nr:AhpC/TSA family protein [Ferruginibacter sp.]
MKNFFWLLMLVQFLTSNGNAQTRGPFVLKCALPLSFEGYIYLSYQSGGAWKRDSSTIKNGQAIFKGVVDAPVLGRLIYNKTIKEVFIEPAAMTFTVNKNDFSKGTITGSKTRKELDILNTTIQKIEERWKIVMDTLTAVNKRSNATFQELKGWVLVPYFIEMEAANLDFFSKYPTSYVTAYRLQIVMRDLKTELVERLFNRFTTPVKASIYGKYVKAELDKRKAVDVGSVAPVFSKPDINGKQCALVNFRGSYVLLDFWGSWCVPCRKGNPHLIALYEKYKNAGFEIIGIAADDKTPDAWRKAVQDDKLPWLQVLKGEGVDMNIGAAYNIMYYPTKILVDKQGKIIGRYGEEEEALDKMLESLFK